MANDNSLMELGLQTLSRTATDSKIARPSAGEIQKSSVSGEELVKPDEWMIPAQTRADLVAEIEANNLTLSISVDNDSDEAVILLKSSETGKVIATLPAEHSRSIQSTIRAVLGQILDSKA